MIDVSQDDDGANQDEQEASADGRVANLEVVVHADHVECHEEVGRENDDDLLQRLHSFPGDKIDCKRGYDQVKEHDWDHLIDEYLCAEDDKHG